VDKKEERNRVEELVEKLLKGEIKLYEVERYVDQNAAAEVRRVFLERKFNVKLEHVRDSVIDFNRVVGRNIENPIGSLKLPIGIAGPLKIRGDYAKGEFYIPLATSEGALVASVNRGCSAITKSGGCNVKILANKMTRAPVFKLKSINQIPAFLEWLEAHREKIREIGESESQYIKFLSYQPFVAGRYVYIRFSFDTCDAMGMNMVTIACDKISRFIEREFGDVKFVSVSSNLCTDKKPTALNMILGRGKSVTAECWIEARVVREKLKTDIDTFVEVVKAKNLVGSALAGSYGFNAHFANIVAAIYLATGQDEAHVVEGSLGFTLAERENDKLYVSVTLPCVQVASVGGGTSLPVQQEMLSLLGCAGGGKTWGSNANKFAEIVAAAVLAGEISLIAAQAAHHLARAHEKFGRKKNVEIND